MSINFSVPTLGGPREFDVEVGTALYFVGANGGGKTRLAVLIEEQLGERVHRISAHRALALNPSVAKISEESARRGLKFGYAKDSASLSHRSGQRWKEKASVSLLNDYDFLVQTLFAEQSNTALTTHKNVRAGSDTPAKETMFERLNGIWQRILPHRSLDISGDDIKVIAHDGQPYPAADMSDGERAAFYLIGQTLAAEPDTLIIFDEPELHLHRAIMSRLWDELEAVRPDCAFVVISHDLEFVAARSGQKFVLKDYKPPNWTIEDVPSHSGFPEELTTLILGSRKPLLFVEGADSSLDIAIFRACYPDWTVVPRGSCEQVIHSVVTMRANEILTRVTCAGIVDADDYTSDEIAYFSSKRIEVLPVSEIENLFMLPNVIEAIAVIEGHSGKELESVRDKILEEMFLHATDMKNQRDSVLRYARRRIDRTLKKIDLSHADDVHALSAAYITSTNSLDVSLLAAVARDAISDAITRRDAVALLRWYDNKGLLSIACKAKGCSQKSFEQWVVRSLRLRSSHQLSDALSLHLPVPNPC